MAQYKTGSVTVTNGSATVTGLGTLWSAEVSAGDIFTIVGSNAWYEVASVASNTSLTLTANYAGTSASGASYAITRDFTTNNGWPYPQKGDIETASLIKRALTDIDSGSLSTVDINGGTIDGTAIGGTTAAAGSFTTLSASSSVTLSGGTANGIPYLNGSKVLTSGSALTFDGTNFGVGSASPTSLVYAYTNSSSQLSLANFYATGTATGGAGANLEITAAANLINLKTGTSDALAFYANASEAMRLTSTGLGIGTSSPSAKLQVNGNVYLGGAARNIYADNGSGIFFNGLNNFGSGIYSDGSGTALKFQTSSVDRMVLASSGNLGLGVTPSAGLATANYRLFEIGLDGGCSIYSGTNQTLIGTNIAWSGGTPNYITTGRSPVLYNQQNGVHSWSTAPSGTAGNAISFTQAMSLFASGGLSVGNTVDGGAKTLNVGRTAATTNTLVGRINFQGYTSTYGAGMASYIPSGAPGIDWQDLRFYTSEGPSAINVERARIDSSGNLLLATTTQDSGARFTLNDQGVVGLSMVETGTASHGRIYFKNGNGVVGQISTNGSATTYSTSSDYRLKENAQPLAGSGAFIDALQPKTWDWKVDGSKGVGFLAHEAQAVSPSSVTGEKDAVDEEGKPVMQAMEYGSAEFIANIIAELQSLRKRVAELEAK